MENYSLYSYTCAAIAYLFFLPIALKRNQVRVPLVVATLCSFFWSSITAYTLYSHELYTSDILAFETIRNGGWYFLLTALLSRQQFNSHYQIFQRSRLTQALIVLLLFIIILEVSADFRFMLNALLGQDIRLTVHLLFAIVGLMMMEQLYRNSSMEMRWALKFLCLGLGAIFIVDFFVYSKSLLFAQLDSSLWDSRGFINALILPLLAISMTRLQSADIAKLSKITVSRKVIFQTTVLFGSGLYLILMSATGFYIRDYGGNWGEIAQIIFLFLAILLLLALLVSGKARALTKVYFSKHFIHYRYDYRDEWIKLSKNIAQLTSVTDLSDFIIVTLANLVDSCGGGIWLKNEQGDFYLAETNNPGFEPPPLLYRNHSLLQFIAEKQWVIDFIEYVNDPDVYEGVDLSQWDAEKNNVWLIVPLFRQNELEALVVLTQAKVPRKLNWEDHDLLKTVGMQLANALALSNASDALSRSRQFEAYNRLSSFLVHDLKNLVAQIALIVKNAEKHKHNPEFIDDAIATLENVVSKIDHLLTQLKKGNVQSNTGKLINLVDIAHDVAQQQMGNRPSLQLDIKQNKVQVIGEKEKMTAILGHLVQNAQEATDEDGLVKLELDSNEQNALIKIMDDGHGMDSKFIAERLFKPFDTTKGNAGMGIGVYEARDYILKLSGHIAVDSQPGEGTTFTITLPLSEHSQTNQNLRLN
ncbi:MAG: PEP-CTERM system histidine kinase PrsK [Methylococcaceae bacterium]|nr:PEP-CTERM system histidine kinase PrsK [Methylococcaceae bacterium]